MKSEKQSTADLMYEIEQIAGRMGWIVLDADAHNKTIGLREVRDGRGNLCEIDTRNAEELLKLSMNFTRKIN
jgi:hypothetical protein